MFLWAEKTGRNFRGKQCTFFLVIKGGFLLMKAILRVDVTGRRAVFSLPSEPEAVLGLLEKLSLLLPFLEYLSSYQYKFLFSTFSWTNIKALVNNINKTFNF